MDMFKYKEQKQSSTLDTAIYPATSVAAYNENGEASIPKECAAVEIPRALLWNTTIDGAIANLPKSDNPVYIATGGGYGSNNTLIDELKKAGTIPVTIPSLKGAVFRELPAFSAEKEEVKKAIAAHLGELATPEAVEQTLSAFYSDEVNTRITKAAVVKAINAQKSIIHESASIYDDTAERAKLAQQKGMKAVLIAGDQDHEKAIEDAKGNINAFNTITSYKKFSTRFQDEWVKLFDEVYLYNTEDKTKPPVLIAEKKGKDAQLVIHSPELYAKFTAKRDLDPSKKNTLTSGANVITAEHLDRAPEPGKSRQVG